MGCTDRDVQVLHVGPFLNRTLELISLFVQVFEKVKMEI